MKSDDRVEGLERYFKVDKNDLPARYRICKRVPVEADLDSEMERLWSVHEKKMEEYNKLMDDIDSKKERIDDMKIPKTSLLELKSKIAGRTLKSCHFCEHNCQVNRREGKTGFCGVGEEARVASEFIHRGEEPELVPSYTIFFSGCTFRCQYCQNWDISQNPKGGRTMRHVEICSLIKGMSEKGIRNVNWVGGDPTPNIHTVLATLNECDVNIPSVWNSNLYLTEESMSLLSGTQDVYLTDFKYGSDDCARKYSKIQGYWDVTTRNHKLAFEDAEVIIRHLVLPNHLECCTERIIKWIGKELGKNVRFNLMAQYRPAGQAEKHPEISRRVSGDEMDRALKMVEKTGLKNITR